MSKVRKEKQGKKKKGKHARGSKKGGDKSTSPRSPREESPAANEAPPMPSSHAPERQGGPLDSPEPLSFVIGSNKLYLAHGTMLKQGQYADVNYVFHVGGKKETMTAHSFLLQHRGPELLAEGPLISKVSHSKEMTIVQIAERALEFVNTSIFGVLLKYIYTGETDVASTDLPVVINLLTTINAAGLSGSPLMVSVEHKCRSLCNIDNLHTVLRLCTDRGLDSLAQYARGLAMSNWDVFIGNRAGCRILGLDLLSELSAEASKGVSVKVHELELVKENVLEQYKGLYESMPAADMELILGSDALPCHRAVLAAFSPSISQRIKIMAGGKAMKSPRGKKRLPGITLQTGNIQLQDRSAGEQFLRFVYYGDQSMGAPEALKLIASTSSFNMPSALVLFEHVINNGIDTHSAVPILGVCFTPGWAAKQSVQELKTRVTNYIVQHFASISLDSFPALPPEVFAILTALQHAHGTPAVVAEPDYGAPPPLPTEKPEMY